MTFDDNSHQHPYYPQYPLGYGYQQAPLPLQPKRRHRALAGVGAAAVAAALVGGGMAIGRATEDSDSTALQGFGSSAAGQSGTQSGGSLFPQGGTGSQGGAQGGTGSQGGSLGGSQRSKATAASATQQRGIVTIVSTLEYQNAQSAGTGMILTSSGEVLTNNHVINGATSVTVTDESTGKSYAADVVGTAPSKDVAVLQLRDASGLTTAKVGDASDVSQLGVGDTVAGVGNAGGTGSLTVATGKVTALERSITATDEGGTNAEKLTGLIQVNAAIVSGDSGGPLYDTDGDIVGIDTAASSGNQSGAAAAEAYAIPIDDALTIANQIESGIETSAVHIGLPGFIGVGIGDSTGSGAAITSVLDGGPADSAGITTGSVITAVNGQQVSGGDALRTILSSLDPGKQVSINWTDGSNANHSAQVRLATGPAD